MYPFQEQAELVAGLQAGWISYKCKFLPWLLLFNQVCRQPESVAHGTDSSKLCHTSIEHTADTSSVSSGEFVENGPLVRFDLALFSPKKDAVRKRQTWNSTGLLLFRK